MCSLDKNNIVISKIGNILIDERRPMKERFRALFTLRNIGGKSSIQWIVQCFDDPSALLKHECAYCLGQMGDPFAVPKLESLLRNKNEESIVRHEAAEALAAIGLESSLEVLRMHKNDSSVEVAETCQLAIEKMLTANLNSKEISRNPYHSVDPAPAFPVNEHSSVEELESILLDEKQPLYERYRAMFTLRNLGSKSAAIALAKGLTCGSALYRHEIAYVLGQMQQDATVKQLANALYDENEHEMVRHECAEALGAIATEECMDILKLYLKDKKRVVRESCEVALDMCDYENSEEFQYANCLRVVS